MIANRPGDTARKASGTLKLHGSQPAPEIPGVAGEMSGRTKKAGRPGAPCEAKDASGTKASVPSPSVQGARRSRAPRRAPRSSPRSRCARCRAARTSPQSRAAHSSARSCPHSKAPHCGAACPRLVASSRLSSQLLLLSPHLDVEFVALQLQLSVLLRSHRPLLLRQRAGACLGGASADPRCSSPSPRRSTQRFASFCMLSAASTSSRSVRLALGFSIACTTTRASTSLFFGLMRRSPAESRTRRHPHGSRPSPDRRRQQRAIGPWREE